MEAEGHTVKKSMAALVARTVYCAPARAEEESDPKNVAAAKLFDSGVKKSQEAPR